MTRSTLQQKIDALTIEILDLEEEIRTTRDRDAKVRARRQIDALLLERADAEETLHGLRYAACHA